MKAGQEMPTLPPAFVTSAPGAPRRVRHIHRWRRAGLSILAALLLALPGRARADAVLMWNDSLLNIIRQTSAALVDGPPEVARQIAIVNTAMYNAANDATGGQYQTYHASVGVTAGASAEAAALGAGYAAMMALFSAPGTEGNPLAAGADTIGGLWAQARPTGVGFTPPGAGQPISDQIVSQINAAFNSAVSALQLTTAPAALNTGLALGVADATLLTTSRLTDGAFQAIQNGLLTNVPAGSGTVAGVYIPPAARPEMMPQWGSVTPFGSASAVTLPALMAQTKPLGFDITTAAGRQALLQSPQYAAALLETQCQGSAAGLSAGMQATCNAAGFGLTTAERIGQTTSALFWNDPGTTMQPPGHWLQIASTVALSQGLDTMEQARLMALVGTSMADAGIAAWGLKYQDNLWRPATAIRDCSDWSAGAFTTCDPTWSSIIATPPHPDYIAGHPAFSGAAATALCSFFETCNVPFSSTSDVYCNGGTPQYSPTGLVIACLLNSVTYSLANGDCNVVQPNGTNTSPLICPITETYASFLDASSGEFGAEYSRVVGGIHTPFAVSDALNLGNQIGATIFANDFQPVPEPTTLPLLATALLALAPLRRRLRGVRG